MLTPVVEEPCLYRYGEIYRTFRSSFQQIPRGDEDSIGITMICALLSPFVADIRAVVVKNNRLTGKQRFDCAAYTFTGMYVDYIVEGGQKE